MNRKFSIFLLCVILLAGAVANYFQISNPEQRMTAYARNHPDEYDPYASKRNSPYYETDVSATALNLFGINAAVVFACGTVCIMGGFVFGQKKGTVNRSGDVFSLKIIVSCISDALIAGKKQAAYETIERFKSSGLIDKIESQATVGRPLRPIDHGINVAKVVEEWATSSDSSNEALITTLQAHLKNLDADKVAAFSKAIYSRFLERLQASRKPEIVDFLRHCGKLEVEKNAPSISNKLFSAISAGAAYKDAAWEAVSDVV